MNAKLYATLYLLVGELRHVLVMQIIDSDPNTWEGEVKQLYQSGTSYNELLTALQMRMENLIMEGAVGSHTQRVLPPSPLPLLLPPPPPAPRERMGGGCCFALQACFAHSVIPHAAE